MNSYRVVSRNGVYIAQEQGRLFGWNDMFCSVYTDSPREFQSPNDAMEAIQKEEMRRRALAPKNYAQTLYIDAYGGIQITRDDNY